MNELLKNLTVMTFNVPHDALDHYDQLGRIAELAMTNGLEIEVWKDHQARDGMVTFVQLRQKRSQ